MHTGLFTVGDTGTPQVCDGEVAGGAGKKDGFVERTRVAGRDFNMDKPSVEERQTKAEPNLCGNQAT